MVRRGKGGRGRAKGSVGERSDRRFHDDDHEGDAPDAPVPWVDRVAGATLSAGSAQAQRWGGSPRPAAAGRQSAGARATAGGSWNGTVSKWGGSPVQPGRDARTQCAEAIPWGVVIPRAVAAPAPVPATYAADTSFAAGSGPVEMRVVHEHPEPRQLTTIEVYRLQPRFQRP